LDGYADRRLQLGLPAFRGDEGLQFFLVHYKLLFSEHVLSLVRQAICKNAAEQNDAAFLQRPEVSAFLAKSQTMPYEWREAMKTSYGRKMLWRRPGFVLNIDNWTWLTFVALFVWYIFYSRSFSMAYPHPLNMAKSLKTAFGCTAFEGIHSVSAFYDWAETDLLSGLFQDGLYMSSEEATALLTPRSKYSVSSFQGIIGTVRMTQFRLRWRN
jgi:hypothetical protein